MRIVWAFVVMVPTWRPLDALCWVMVTSRARFVWGLALLLSGCRSSNGPSGADGAPTAPVTPTLTSPSSSARTTAEPAAIASAEPPAPELPPPLTGEALQELPVPGFGAAVVSVPLAARGPRPVVIALHGNYDRPEWQCEVWRDITGGFPWVLCPRGVPRGDAPKSADRWTYTTAAKVAEELRVALNALAERFPAHVDVQAPLFTGFSLGAILGVHLLSAPEGLPRVQSAVLTEGGYGGWHKARAEAFVTRGGARVLFACGQSACRHASKQTAKVLEKQGIQVEIASGGDIGHTYDGAVAEAIRERWAWLTEADARFAPNPSAAPAAR